MTRYAAMFGVLVWAMLVSSAQAVGLGDITLRSALTEPLNAEIRILNPEDLSPAELNVSLASGADFRRAGVERPFFLTALDFTVRLDGDALVVDVTSEEAVQEPFLDFLVELRWPSGRLIREYTLLLDPPIFAPSDGGMDQVFPGADPFDSETSSQSERASPSQDTSVPTAGRIDQLAENQYRVENNDTLWEIALSARQNPAQTPQQVMLAIQDLNPDAFINSNINRIKAGRLLTLPSADQVAVRSAAEATQDVARQNGGLRGTPPAADTQLSASDETATGLSGAAEARDPDGFLEVVTDSAEESEETGAVTGDTNEVARLQNELAIQQELNDELRRQYDDQQTRLNDLEEQVQLLTRLVDLQSESAAQLQAVADELARREAAGTTAEAESGAVEQAAPPPSEDTPTEEPVVDTAVVPAVPMAPNLEAMTQPQVPALVSRLLAWVSQPYNAALVLLALVLLLALTNLTLKRRSAAAEENALELDDDLLVEDTEELAEVDSEWSSASETIEDVEEEIAQPFESSTAPLNPASAAEAIENAELYMAFQRYDEAESALSTALRQVPGEPSLQLKLLELYAETGQHSDFDSLAAEFSGDPEAIAGLRQQLDSAGSGDIEDDLDENGNLNDLDLSFDEDDDDFAFSLEADVERPSRTNLMNLDHELSDLELPDLDVPDLDIPELDVPELDQAMANELRSDASTEFASDNLEFDRTAVPEPPERDVSASIEDDRMMDFDLSGVELEEPASQSLEAKSPPDDQLAKLDTDFDLGEFEEGAPEDSLHELAMAEDTSLDNEAELDESADEFNLDELSEDLDFSELDDIAEVAGLDEAVAEPAESSAPSAEPVAPEANLEEEVQAPDAFDSAMDFPPLTAGDGEDWDDDFDFLEGSDEVATKLDLARAYVDMEDAEGARDILNEVVEEGDEQQKADAKVLLESLG